MSLFIAWGIVLIAATVAGTGVGIVAAAAVIAAQRTKEERHGSGCIGEGCRRSAGWHEAPSCPPPAEPGGGFSITEIRTLGGRFR